MKPSGYLGRMSAQDIPLLNNKRLPIPKLDMELTERCNNRCIHCYINRPADDREARRNEMNTEEIRAIVREAADLGCLLVRFTGGEPLLRQDFEEIYVFARKLGLAVLLFTNATRIDEQLARRMAEIPPLYPVEISMYGASVETYERVTRTPGSFEAACRGVDMLRRYGVKCMIKGLLIAEDGETQEQMSRWMQNRFPDVARKSVRQVLDLRTRRDSNRKNSRIRSLRPAPETLSHYILDSESDRRSILAFCKNLPGRPGKRLFRCSAGQGQACVDAYGKLQPCLLLRCPDTAFDLRCGGIRDALASFFPQMRDRPARNRLYLERCAKCWIHGLCDQCPARSWSESGELDVPVAYYCEIAHAMARHLGLLAAGEKGWEDIDWKRRLQNPAPESIAAAFG